MLPGTPSAAGTMFGVVIVLVALVATRFALAGSSTTTAFEPSERSLTPRTPWGSTRLRQTAMISCRANWSGYAALSAGIIPSARAFSRSTE